MPPVSSPFPIAAPVHIVGLAPGEPVEVVRHKLHATARVEGGGAGRSAQYARGGEAQEDERQCVGPCAS